jgi:hypothetical protein
MEDFSIESWENEASPKQMMDFTDSKLLWVRKARQGTVWDVWAGAELERRRDERISELIKSLTCSSNRLEGLTKNLRTLTWVLIVLTSLAVVLTALTVIVPFVKP